MLPLLPLLPFAVLHVCVPGVCAKTRRPPPAASICPPPKRGPPISAPCACVCLSLPSPGAPATIHAHYYMMGGALINRQQHQGAQLYSTIKLAIPCLPAPLLGNTATSRQGREQRHGWPAGQCWQFVLEAAGDPKIHAPSGPAAHAAGGGRLRQQVCQVWVRAAATLHHHSNTAPQTCKYARLSRGQQHVCA